MSAFRQRALRGWPVGRPQRGMAATNPIRNAVVPALQAEFDSKMATISRCEGVLALRLAVCEFLPKRSQETTIRHRRERER